MTGRPWRVLAGVVAVSAAALASSAGPALAGHTQLVDLCLGVDHPPFEITPPGGGNSYLIGNGHTAPPLANAVIDVVVSGPQPPDPFQVETDADGWIDGFAAPIQTYGTYPVVLSNGGHEIGGGVLEVGSDDVPCPDRASQPAPGLASGPTEKDPLGVLAAILAGRDVSVVPDVAELFWGGGFFFPDLPGDLFFSDPRYEPGSPSPAVDLRRAGGSILRAPSIEELFAPQRVFCGPDEQWDVVCPPGTSAPPPPTDFFVTLLEFGGPVPAPSNGPPGTEDLFEYAVVYESDGDPSNDWMPQGPYTWDAFQGTDRWYVARGQTATGTWSLDVVDAWSGETVDSDARAVLLDDAVVFMVPTEELAAPTGWRGYGFKHDGSYQPQYSAVDVTGEDPTEPLIPMPTITFASDLPEEPGPSPAPSASEPAPSASPTEVITVDEVAAVAETGEDGGALWPLVALGGLTALGGVALLRRRDDGALLAPPDPCAEELATLDDARSRCAEAQAAAAAARERLTAADAALAGARAALAEARAELPGAGTRDRTSWVESGGRRIDSGDVAAANEADAATWSAYRAGEITAEQAMERWGKRGTPEEVQRLRDADARAKARESDVAAAEAKHAAATAAVEAADRAASAACRAADVAAARLERCRDEHTTPEPAPTAATGGTATATGTTAGTTTAPPPAGPTVTAPPPTAPVTTAGGDDPRDAEPQDGCCASGTGVVYGRSTTSFGVFVGRELVNLTAVCVSDPGRWIEFEVLLIKYGLGAQVGAGGLGGVVWGAKHPRDVFDVYTKQAGGAGFDLDLGGSWVKLAKSGVQLKKGGKLWDALKKLPGRSVPPPKLPPAELEAVRKAAAEAAKELGTGAGQGAAASAAGQGAKGTLGDLIVLPLGVGVGVAAHYGKVERSQVVAMSGCRQCQGRRRR